MQCAAMDSCEGLPFLFHPPSILLLSSPLHFPFYQSLCFDYNCQSPLVLNPEEDIFCLLKQQDRVRQEEQPRARKLQIQSKKTQLIVNNPQNQDIDENFVLNRQANKSKYRNSFSNTMKKFVHEMIEEAKMEVNEDQSVNRYQKWGYSFKDFKREFVKLFKRPGNRSYYGQKFVRSLLARKNEFSEVLIELLHKYCKKQFHDNSLRSQLRRSEPQIQKQIGLYKILNLLENRVKNQEI